MIIINCINIMQIDDIVYSMISEKISKQRQLASSKYYKKEDRIRCLCSDFLLKYSFYQRTGQKRELDLYYNEYHKPYLQQPNDFKFNISHSGEWVVLAYSENEIGVDIEEIQPDVDNIVSNFFSEEEIAYIMVNDIYEQYKRFTQIWTLKESYLKYLGVGLSKELSSFYVNVLNGTVYEKKKSEAEPVHLMSNLFKDKYYLAICGNETDIEINEINKEDILNF